jgi:hypothetical protein
MAKFLFPRNSNVCSILILIFDTDPAHIYSEQQQRRLYNYQNSARSTSLVFTLVSLVLPFWGMILRHFGLRSGGFTALLNFFCPPAKEGKLVKYALLVHYLCKIIILTITGCRTLLKNAEAESYATLAWFK